MLADAECLERRRSKYKFGPSRSYFDCDQRVHPMVLLQDVGA